MDHAPETFAELHCHLCGYDLRAHPQDGRCPECGTSVAESRRLAAIARRPAWRNSDPRWRRRILAGTWTLLLLPLMDVLRVCGWASRVPVPNLFDRFTGGTLCGALVCDPWVYQPLVFCIGVVLLFSKERGRRAGKLDWTRRWGILCSYVVLLLSALTFFFIIALGLRGIAAVYQTIPLRSRPQVTPLFSYVSAQWSLFRAYPGEMARLLLVAFSSIAILLACVPLFDALRSIGRNRMTAVLLAPLALSSLLDLGQVGYCLDFSGGASAAQELYRYGVYFWPLWGSNMLGFGVIIVEALKWCIILTIAVWLSIAQLAAWRQHKKQDQHPSP